jgi:hypothetical protein
MKHEGPVVRLLLSDVQLSCASDGSLVLRKPAVRYLSMSVRSGLLPRKLQDGSTVM